MDVVMGVSFPVLSLRSINMFPAFIGSLKVILITLFVGTLTAFFTGSVAVIVGGILSIV
jgi:hypothetical protein